MAKNAWGSIKRGSRAWARLARKIADFQARILLTIFYAVMVLPFGLAVRWFGDPLRIKRRPAHWLDHPDETYDATWAQRQ